MGLLQRAIETYDANTALIGVYRDGHEPLAPIGHILTSANIEITLNDLGKAALAGLAEYPISLDKNEYFLLGDNRSGSEDSRFSNVGNVKFRQIKGKVWLRIQPVSRFGLISSR